MRKSLTRKVRKCEQSPQDPRIAKANSVYEKLLASRLKEQRDRRSESLANMLFITNLSFSLCSSFMWL